MGRLISDRMLYRNHYMCSGETTSCYEVRTFEIPSAFDEKVNVVFNSV